jgi:hypothetical protein
MVRHNKLVDDFEEVFDSNNLASGAWVSKRWLKGMDLRSARCLRKLDSSKRVEGKVL